MTPEQISKVVASPFAHQIMASYKAGTLSEQSATELINSIIGK